MSATFTACRTSPAQALAFNDRYVSCCLPQNKNKRMAVAMTLEDMVYFALGCFVGSFGLAALVVVVAFRRRRDALAKRRAARGLQKSYP